MEAMLLVEKKWKLAGHVGNWWRYSVSLSAEHGGCGLYTRRILQFIPLPGCTHHHDERGVAVAGAVSWWPSICIIWIQYRSVRGFRRSHNSLDR